jgi:multidrug efflux pump
MTFTEIFIRRPVLASVVSLFILFFGLNSLVHLPIRQFPKMDDTVITVTTNYPGANADLITGFITTPLEAAIASAEGIDYMVSSSIEGTSVITCNIKLNFDPQIAFTDIMSKVQQTLNVLPPDAERPVVVKKSKTTTPLLYISMSSDELTPQQITDYAIRVVQPQLQTIDGVAQVEILGGQTYAMRIFLDPSKMAAAHVTPAEIFEVLQNNNFLSAPGSTKGEYVAISMRADTNLTNAQEFARLIVRNDKYSIIHLSDIAKIELGSEKYDSSVRFNGQRAVFLAITPTPIANPLTVIQDILTLFPSIQNQFPPSLSGKIAYDATDYIRASIREVMHTIIEAALIVVVVIFLFLGSLRSVLIPIVTIPLSLIGVCSLMLFLGYSINLLTLLAFVLAIGLVVDDAIVVVENIHRHIEHGQSPIQAAIAGTREIGRPIIAMTITLAAVYAPIGFMSGLTGALFKEFAFTLACSVIISGIIALTLSPMMCSKILVVEHSKNQMQTWIDNFFQTLKIRYQHGLHSVLQNRSMILLLAGATLLMLPYIYSQTAKETAPEEDESYFFVMSTAPEYATINYVEAYTPAFENIYHSFPEAEYSFMINGKTPMSGLVLKPWDQRSKSEFALLEPLQNKLNTIPGLNSYAMIPPALPGGGSGPPVQFIIKSTADFQTLAALTNTLLDKANHSGLFIFLDNSLKFNHPEVDIEIDRAKAAELGLNMRSIGATLNGALSGGYVNFFDFKGRSYKVIPQLDRRFRLNPEQLRQIYVSTEDGKMVPLSTITRLVKKVTPNDSTHFQQLNSATIQGVMRPNVTLGEGIAFLQQAAQTLLPKGFIIDYAGQSRQYMQEGAALILVFFLAIITIFLVLAAQYESYRDPLIILIAVPMSILGALIPLNLGAASINIYTQVGLITLIGLISKHGILIVDFANHLQRTQQLDRRAAVEEAAAIRLRPILMTTSAMIFGVFPLLIASGAGAVSRFNIGLVIASGLLIGTLFTLFVVPTIYTYLAADHRNDDFE